MKSCLVNIAGLAISWYYTDLHAESSIQNMLCPILVAVFLMILAVKLAYLFGPEKARGGGSDGGFGGFGGGGDGGGGGDC